MSEQYKCDKCGKIEDVDISDYISEIPHSPDDDCDGMMHPLRWTKGGDGSHWEGCEEVHWDCRIAHLEKKLARRDEIIARLKEDAERLATRAVYWDDYGKEYECIHCGKERYYENFEESENE